MKLDFITPKFVYRTALGVSFLFVVTVAIFFHIQMKSLNDSANIIYESNKKQFELEKIITRITQTENEVRNYIITKDSSFLENDFNTKSEILKSLEFLSNLKSGDSDSKKQIGSLEFLARKRFDQFQKTLEFYESDPQNSLLLNHFLLEGTKQTENIREIAYHLIDEEVTKLKLQNISHRYEIENSTITAFSLTIITLVILLFSLKRINTDYEALQILNEDLSLARQISDNAEKVAGISHWKYNLTTRRYYYSDNFYRILGVEPKAFKQDFKNFMAFIHPDDKETVIKNHENSLKNLKPTSYIYRIVRPNGEIRFVNSIGDFIRNSKGDIVKIGVTYDITDQHKVQSILEEKNNSLIAINAELESFNHIVSHDLQEPLRKIQMFISRINDTEWDSISEKGQEYFNKIKASANRMQNLMIDLVNYSRTIKENKVFEKINLNNLLQDVIIELSENIEDKNAILKIEKLPTIKGIKFQIHQLFINLLSNSLKYSKADISPNIKITVEKIIPGEKFENIEIAKEDFFKIVVSDNGIGFKQEFSDKIFLLFKRLDTKTEYSGTGLGLAICKKIVENHKGYIKAEGTPDVGSIFTIYLPK